ncbi:hypothetical protein GBA52_010619 [Prunus armeniaca]|nr:hypothetical protein GBA52_010619 [Prunus armeniaca]
MADKEPRVATNEGTVASMGRGGNPHHLKDNIIMTCAAADPSFFRQNVPRQVWKIDVDEISNTLSKLSNNLKFVFLSSPPTSSSPLYYG